MSNAQRRRAVKATPRAPLDMAAQMSNAALNRKLAAIQAAHGQVSEAEAKEVADITVAAMEAVYRQGSKGAEAFAQQFIRVFQIGYAKGAETAFFQAFAVFQPMLAEAGYELEIDDIRERATKRTTSA